MNLLDPLAFDEGEAGKFANRHKCGICLSSLFTRHAPDRKWYVVCPEHGPVYQHTVITNRVADETKVGRRAGSFDLRIPDTSKTPEQILKELGYD